MDGDAPEPIEVELVAHDPHSDRRGRWRREPEPVGGEEPTPEEDQRVRRARAERTRLVLVGAVAAVLALVLGWMIGRATTGESDVVADDATDTARATTTVAAPFETLPIDGEEIGGADFDEPAEEEPAVTTRPATGPTTTEPTAPTVEPIAVDERLAGVPVRLVGVELGGALVEVDLGVGTLTTFDGPRIVADGSPLLIGPDWVVTASNSQSRVIRSDGTLEPADLGEPWQLLHVPDTELFWRSPRSQLSSGGPVYRLVDLTGDPVGPELELPVNTWPMLVDPASGGLIVGAGSRNYAVHPDGIEHLGLGAVIGASAEALVTYDCDAELVCSLFRIDRATGEATAVPPDPTLAEPYQWMSMAGWGAPSTMSPDGRWVALIGSTWNASVSGIVDIETGRFVELTRVPAQPLVAWSSDSRWAFTLDGETPMAYDTRTDEQFPVFTAAAQWVQLGARPLLPDEAGAGSDGGTLLRVVPGTTRNTSVVAEEAVEG